jgi:murein DD-endopeptidase MepM/ murein hydrolase activator NlpD
VLTKLRILAQKLSRNPPLSPHRVWLLAFPLAAGVGVAAFGIAPGTVTEQVDTRLVEQQLPAPALVISEHLPYVRDVPVQRGDTLGSVLARGGVNDPAASAFLRTDRSVQALYQLRPGKNLHIETDEDGTLLGLRYLTQQGDLLSVSRNGSALQVQSAPAAYEARVAMRSGEISSSLFAAADEAGMPDAVTFQLADIFGGDIDFYHDIRSGDRFAVVYEVLYAEGQPVRIGRVLAAEFVNRGITYRALHYANGEGQGGYYAPDGKSLRKAFLRSPMEFSRITSGFSTARFHPILQTWRAHKGIDYAAPMGTPVRATADGKVALLGRQSGYGNLIVLQHQGTYSTAYGHLSRFASGLKRGGNVHQGEVIGYVGMTGLATGPHLHYEFRVSDVQRNPLSVALPNAVPITPQEKPAFFARTGPLLAQMEMARRFSLAAAE